MEQLPYSTLVPGEVAHRWTFTLNIPLNGHLFGEGLQYKHMKNIQLTFWTSSGH